MEPQAAADAAKALSGECRKLANEVLSPIVNQWSNPTELVAALRAFRTLEMRPRVAARREISEILWGDGPAELRRQAATTELYFGGYDASDRALELVREGLEDPEDSHHLEYLQALARRGAGAFPIADCIDPLIDASHPLCLEAMKTLTAIGRCSERAVERLIGCLQSADDMNIRYGAAMALSLPATQSLAVREALARALSDEQRMVREMACRALGRTGSLAAPWVESIAAQLSVGPAVPEALGRIGTPAAIAALHAVRLACGEDAKLARAGKLLYRAETELEVTRQLRRLGEDVSPPDETT